MNTTPGSPPRRWPFSDRSIRPRDVWPALGLVLLSIGLLRLAVSDGGRQLQVLTVVQVLALTASAGLIAMGAIRDGPVLRALAGVVLVMAGTTPWSIRADSSVRELILWMTYLSIVLITLYALRGLQSLRRFLDGLLAIGGWLVLVALYIFWGAGNPHLRWYSTFYAPNAFAAFLLLMLPLAAARCCLATNRRDAFDYGAVTVLLGTAFVLTFSRGAYVTLALTAAVAVMIVRPVSWQPSVRRALVAGALTAVSVAALTHTPGIVFKRTASVLDSGSSSVQDRLSFWRSGARMFIDHPIVGTGPGTFAYAHAKYQGRYYAQDAHNLYVQTVAETGLPGLAALVLLLGSVVALGKRTLRKARGTEEYALIAGTILSLLAFFVHSAVEMSWHFPANPAVAFAMVGVLAWYDRWSGNDHRRPGLILRHRATRGALIVLVIGAGAIALIVQAADREFRTGRQLVIAGRWAESSRRFQRAMALNPLDPRLPSAQAAAIQQLPAGGDSAVPLIQRAAALDRMNAYYPLQLAEVLLPRIHEAGVRRDVERLYKHALDLDPFHYPEAYRRLAQLHAKEGRVEEAAMVYERAVTFYAARSIAADPVLRMRLWPRVAALFAESASFLAAQKGTDHAVAVLEILLRQDPAWQPAFRQIADLYVQTHRYRDAYWAIVAGRAQLTDALGTSMAPPRLPGADERVYPR